MQNNGFAGGIVGRTVINAPSNSRVVDSVAVIYRGLTQVTNWVKLKFAAMNLKKLAMWKWRDGYPYASVLILKCKFSVREYCQKSPPFA